MAFLVVAPPPFPPNLPPEVYRKQDLQQKVAESLMLHLQHLDVKREVDAQTPRINLVTTEIDARLHTCREKIDNITHQVYQSEIQTKTLLALDEERLRFLIHETRRILESQHSSWQYPTIALCVGFLGVLAAACVTVMKTPSLKDRLPMSFV